LRRFGEDLLLWDFRQLPDDLTPQVIIGQHPNPFRRDDGRQPVYRLLDKSSFSEKTENLL
jgi:hypothetical protein